MTKLALVFVAMAAALALQPAMADDVPTLGKVHCTVKTIAPEGATFFNKIGPPPQVGSTIDLDLASPEINDLTFSSGQIGIKQVRAKLVKKDGELPNPSYAYYEGTYRSATSDYTGVLYGYAGSVTGVSIQIVRHLFQGGFELNQLEMECTAVQ